MSGTEPAAILLTGASGFVGQRIAPRLAAAASAFAGVASPEPEDAAGGNDGVGERSRFILDSDGAGEDAPTDAGVSEAWPMDFSIA